jgi:LAGLIDADG endonuclease/NADH-Ubiquinone oxidoreductase (complex I), chain 5 N-terminus
MYLSILILPSLGSLISGFMGRKLGSTGAQFITISCLILASILSSIAFYEVGLKGSPVYVNLGSWIDSDLLSIDWEFAFDQITVIMLIPVLFISTLIHVYSISYMNEDPAKNFGKILLWVKLSNSGDFLKLMVPNYNWKFISGWINYSGMVTSHKMSENEMEYRGSKSEFQLPQPNEISVKEQRVDGSYFIKLYLIKLRYTLMGFERNYQIKIPSNQLIFKNYSTFNYLSQINPWVWTGLIDAEGSFIVTIDKNIKRTLGWRVQVKFQLDLHKRDVSLLLNLQQGLGGIGSIKSYLNKVTFAVNSKQDLTKLIIHLEKYPLLTQKAADFILFKKVVDLMNNKIHLSFEGLQQIINIKASMNLGLSDFLKSEFKDFSMVKREIINTENIPNPNWLSGFVTGEGCFDVRIFQQLSNKIGYRVQLRFRISQHEKDLKLMECIRKYLGSGKVYKYYKQPAVVLTIYKFSDITNIIIPFFKLNPLLGIKLLDYLDWCKIANLINKGSHLNFEGLNAIREIKSGMNTGRNKN